jgi:hypothetical protein
LQARFAIVARPARVWDLELIKQVMTCCIILHNMIIADDTLNGRPPCTSAYQVMHGRRSEDHIAAFEQLQASDVLPESFNERYGMAINSAEHYALKRDLVQHLWDTNH